MKTFPKDPDAVLDYPFDWTKWLGEDTIIAKTITVPSGISNPSSSIDDDGKVVKVWLSGGTIGESYQVACRITTAGGRTDERTVLIEVKQR